MEENRLKYAKRSVLLLWRASQKAGIYMSVSTLDDLSRSGSSVSACPAASKASLLKRTLSEMNSAALWNAMSHIQSNNTNKPHG